MAPSTVVLIKLDTVSNFISIIEEEEDLFKQSRAAQSENTVNVPWNDVQHFVDDTAMLHAHRFPLAKQLNLYDPSRLA